MLTSEVLRVARGLIDTPEKWCKDDLRTDDGRLCAIGAIRVAGGCTKGWTRVPLDAGYALGKACGTTEGGRPWPVSFNDDPSTTHADILAAFDRAIAQAEADENPEPTPNADTLTGVMAACDSLAGTVTDAILHNRTDLDRGVVEAYCAAELFCAAQDCARMFTLSMEELAALRAAIHDTLGLGA